MKIEKFEIIDKYKQKLVCKNIIISYIYKKLINNYLLYYLLSFFLFIVIFFQILVNKYIMLNI